MPTDIHASSVAIEALRMSKISEFETSAEDAAVHIKKICNSNIDTLEIHQLSDFLNILSGNEQRDLELELKVLARLKKLRNRNGWGYPEPSIGLSCETIFTILKLVNPPKDVIKDWINYLLQYQFEDGGWGATHDSKSAIIPTSQVVRLLNVLSDKSLAKNQSRSIEFVQKYLRRSGWKDLTDTFSASIVLRILDDIEGLPFKIIQQGIDFFL